MKTYFQYLIWMMLFVIVIEMVFPDSSYRKYLKLILSCILIYTMLSPVVNWLGAGSNGYESYVRYYQNVLDAPEGVSYEAALEKQQECLKTMYEDSIKAYVEQNFEVGVYTVSAEWQGEELESIHLVVGSPSEAINIGEIKIEDKSETVSGNEEVLKNKIKSSLSDFYNVQVRNIYITVQKN